MTTRITTPYSAQTTADDIVAGLDLTGQRIVVTGGASGIGLETARSLAGAGAEVTLAVRDLAAGRQAAALLMGETGSKQVLVAPLDLADQTSVRSFVASWHGPLDVLINNAGLMAAPLMRTPEGWEMQFATNHLGHFTLATGLRGALATAARTSGQARVVSVSSSAHLRSGIDFDDIHFRVRPYDAWLAYAQSKTANVLLAVEGSRRWADDGITINALMPGAIRTGLQRYVSDSELDRMRAATGSSAPGWKTPQQGAATSVLLAVAPLLDGVGGKYFEDCNEALPNEPGTRRGVAAHALDPEAAGRLWQVSADTVGA
ncbi:MAG TPA: SDR family NAD(P)-dependent oxidoreductase [Streptosporangiaceae bacterium]|nr:SDR family NAD(P)-dependent oxidoreductase [Streptosporangiaceae bacterium]